MIFFKLYIWIAIKKDSNCPFQHRTLPGGKLTPPTNGIVNLTKERSLIDSSASSHLLPQGNKEKEKRDTNFLWRVIARNARDDLGWRKKKGADQTRKTIVIKRQWQMRRLIYCISRVVYQVERFPIGKEILIYARISGGSARGMVSRRLERQCKMSLAPFIQRER